MLFCADLKKFQKLKEPPVKMEGEGDEKQSIGKMKAEKRHGKRELKCAKRDVSVKKENESDLETLNSC